MQIDTRYKRDDFEEISRALNSLVEEAENADNNLSPQIKIEDAQNLISQYSPDSADLKKAIFLNVRFCLYCGIQIFNQSLEDMYKVTEFIKLNHKAYAETKLNTSSQYMR